MHKKDSQKKTSVFLCFWNVIFARKMLKWNWHLEISEIVWFTLKGEVGFWQVIDQTELVHLIFGNVNRFLGRKKRKKKGSNKQNYLLRNKGVTKNQTYQTFFCYNIIFAFFCCSASRNCCKLIFTILNKHSSLTKKIRKRSLVGLAPGTKRQSGKPVKPVKHFCFLTHCFSVFSLLGFASSC